MTTLYLIRHAEAEGNVFRRLQGQYDSFITPNGMKQIAALAKRFDGVAVDAVYASDLTRTRTTAQAICVPKGLELHPEPRFREMHCGVWENLPFGYLDHVDPERNYAFSHRAREWFVEESETFPVYTGRFLQALEEVARRHEGGSVAVFSHGMVMRGVMQRLFFPDRDNLGHSENTAVTKLLWDGGSFRLEYLNDGSHLPPEISTLGRQMWWRSGDHRDFNMWFRDAQADDTLLLKQLGLPEVTGGIVRISMLTDRPSGALLLRTDGPETARLDYLALLPAHRGIGLSAQLLGEAVSLSRDAGKQVLTLPEAVECPAARRLFESYGFRDGQLPLKPRVIPFGGGL